MKYNYEGKCYTGSRSEIKKNIQEYLEGKDIWAKGEFDLGAERFCGHGNVSEIKRQIIKEVLVPYEYNGKLYSAIDLRIHLNTMVLFDLVNELGPGLSKKAIISEIMESLNEI